ncbi:hypothetical protein BH10BAC3_BH10BAC3_01180 [soil metagenome]
MKHKLQSILFGTGLLAFVFSGCQKQNEFAQPAARSAETSVAANNGVGHDFNSTFTKYITNYPFMSGVVGGDVGTGTYAGEVLKFETVGLIDYVEALYHFNGSIHSFTAHVFVVQNNSSGTGIAAITGHVTEGWLKGAALNGEYNVWSVCPIPTPGDAEGTKCYQGMLHVHVPKG